LSFISALLLCLEISIILFTSKLEYSENGILITVKKTLGYSFFDRNKKMILFPAVFVLLSSAATAVMVIILHIGNVFIIPAIAVMLLIIEFVVLYIQSKRLEKMKISAVLKGAGV
jgi:hypothetical protein